MSEEKSSWNSLETNADKLTSVIFVIRIIYVFNKGNDDACLT